jgi:RNA polymerase sigma-70 factor, ECF subfamily
VQAVDLLEQLNRSLAELPPQQAEVFCLRFFSDMTNQEIARELRISKSAVGVLLHRARAQIANLLAPVYEAKGGRCDV